MGKGCKWKHACTYLNWDLDSKVFLDILTFKLNQSQEFKNRTSNGVSNRLSSNNCLNINAPARNSNGRVPLPIRIPAEQLIARKTRVVCFWCWSIHLQVRSEEQKRDESSRANEKIHISANAKWQACFILISLGSTRWFYNCRRTMTMTMMEMESADSNLHRQVLWWRAPPLCVQTNETARISALFIFLSKTKVVVVVVDSLGSSEVLNWL